jgi:hypothetical protein
VIHGDIKIYRKNHFIKVKTPDLSPKAKLYFAWHPACFVPTQFFHQYGFFEKKYKIAGDIDFLLRLKRNWVDFYYTPQAKTNFRLEGASDNVWAGSMESFEIYKKYFSLATALRLLWRRTALRQINATIANTILRDKNV